MRRRFRVSSVLVTLVLSAAATGGAVAVGCSAQGDKHEFGDGGADTTTTTATGNDGGGGGGPGSGGMTGEGGGLVLPDAGGDAPADVTMNPCGTGCGDTELCDPDHLGLDDNCNGVIDEGCPCASGQAHACFKGDPSYHNTPGCYDGTQKCDENGTWGPCLGGVHATDGCFQQDVTNCHAISAPPFADVNLKTGTGNFSANAVPGTEVWTVTCPVGVSPCPAVTGSNPTDDFKPLQSGEYEVTYTKGLAGGGTDSCTYPLFVGAPGLRVELEWEHNLGGSGVDLDLHMHQPNNTQPWAISGSPYDCGYANCTISSFQFGGFNAPSWFNGAAPPAPVNWYLDPVMSNNTCFYAPRGAGASWQSFGMGCHNPRLDIDNITCSPGQADPNASDFCAPENINVDFPPQDEWTRIGVHYYSSHGLSYDVHPRVKVYCNGALAASLGDAGYYVPEAPLAFHSSDSSTRYWLVADVAFTQGTCGADNCVVVPLYQDDALKTPLLTTQSVVTSSFGPPYPPPP